MTDQNNAAQAADQEIEAIMEQAQVFASAWSFLGGPFDNGSGLEQAERERSNLRALLSKLRAEGVQAGEPANEAREAIAAGLQDSAYCAGLQRGFMLGDHGDHEGLRKALESRDGYVKAIKDASAALASAPVAAPIQWPTMPPSKGQSPVLFEDGYAEGWAKCMDECRRAVSAASAPVAGEAQPVAWLHQCRKKPKLSTVTLNKREPSLAAKGYMPIPLYAAPQASEADDLIDALGRCRDAFPIPDKVGSKLDLLWQEAMSDPTAVPEYVKLRAALSAQPGAQKEQSDA